MHNDQAGKPARGGTAFTIALGGIAAGGGGGGGKSARQAPGPGPTSSGRKGPFKFLQKGEGVQAAAINAGKIGSDGSNLSVGRAGQDSHSLREAMAMDIRKGAGHDPFSEALVAVPRRPPPRMSIPSDNNRAESTIAAAEPPNTSAPDDATSRQRPAPAVARNASAQQQPPGAGSSRSTSRRELPPSAASTRPADGAARPREEQHAEAAPTGRLALLAQRRSQATAARLEGGDSAPSAEDATEKPPPRNAAINRASTPMQDLRPARHADPEVPERLVPKTQYQAPSRHIRHHEDDGQTSATGQRKTLQATIASGRSNLRKTAEWHQLDESDEDQQHTEAMFDRRARPIEDDPPAVYDQDAHDDEDEGEEEDNEPQSRRFQEETHASQQHDGSPRYQTTYHSQPQVVAAASGRPGNLHRGLRGQHNNPSTVGESDRERALLEELDREVEELREEKAKYRQLVLDLQRDRQRQMQERDTGEEDLQKERDEFERFVAEERKLLRKERRELDDVRRQATSAAQAEKETVRRLQHELSVMKDGIERLQGDSRDRERQAKAEADRLRRELADANARNADLVATLKRQQSAELVHGAATIEAARPNVGRTNVATRGGRGGAASDVGGPPGSSSRDVSPPSSVEAGPGARARGANTTKSRDTWDDGASADDDDFGRGGMRGDEVTPSTSAPTTLQVKISERQRRLAEEQRAREEQLQSPRIAQQPRGAVQPSVNTRTSAMATARTGTTTTNLSIPSLSAFLDEEPVPSETFPDDRIVSQNNGPDGKSERQFRSGKREVNYTNGTRKVTLPSGHVNLYFSNGDIKRTFPNGKSTYWYAAAQTTHTQYPNGTQLFQFHATQQFEKHHPDGSKEILYPEGVYKVIRSDGTEDTVFPDGFDGFAAQQQQQQPRGGNVTNRVAAPGSRAGPR